MSDLSDYSEALWINVILRNTASTGSANVYLALYTVNPTDAGGGTEAAFAGYGRQAITFAAPVGNSVANSNAQTYAAITVSPVTITAIGILDASTSGNLLWWKALSPTVAYAINDIPEFVAGGVTCTLPTTGGLSEYTVAKMLNVQLRNQSHTGSATLYVGAFSSAPSAAGGGTEWNYSGYARQAIAFGAPSSGVTVNSGSVVFPAVAGSGVTLTSLAVFDAATGGNMLSFKVLSGSVSYAVGNILRLAASSYSQTMA